MMNHLCYSQSATSNYLTELETASAKLIHPTLIIILQKSVIYV